MTTQTLKLYQSPKSPNSRRVRMFLAEKSLSIPTVDIDLGQKEQRSDAYRAINPRQVVPALGLADGTVIGEVPAIFRYLEEAFPAVPLLGATPADKALVTMWERRAELEGFAAVMEAVRNAAPGLKGRALSGPHDYEQIPALAERSRLRVQHFLVDTDRQLANSAYLAGARFSAADITALAAVDFAINALQVEIPETLRALRDWHATVSARPSAKA